MPLLALPPELLREIILTVSWRDMITSLSYRFYPSVLGKTVVVCEQHVEH
jgi:hypothetical protein